MTFIKKIIDKNLKLIRMSLCIVAIYNSYICLYIYLLLKLHIPGVCVCV